MKYSVFNKGIFMNSVSINIPSSGSKGITGNFFVYVVEKVMTEKKPFKIEQVNDNFYRSNNITEKELQLLQVKGIKKIVNLKTMKKEKLENLQKVAAKYGIEIENISINQFNIKKTIGRIIEVLKDSKVKVVHCEFGIDRTGFVTALERYIIENRSMPDAIKEMKAHGFKGLRNIIFGNFLIYLKKFAKQNPL